jgi:hypothetical protein
MRANIVTQLILMHIIKMEYKLRENHSDPIMGGWDVRRLSDADRGASDTASGYQDSTWVEELERINLSKQYVSPFVPWN